MENMPSNSQEKTGTVLKKHTLTPQETKRESLMQVFVNASKGILCMYQNACECPFLI